MNRTVENRDQGRSHSHQWESALTNHRPFDLVVHKYTGAWG